MRLSIKYLLGCLALLFLLPACKSSDDVEEATLDLSTETLTFAKDASEQTVTVSTNKDSWSAFSTQEGWLSVEQQGQTLKVKAVANEQGRDRIASVIVNAGGLQKRIAVKQSAADVILEPEETSVAFSAVGGSKKIAYTSNGVGTKVELGSAVDWLTIDKVTSHSFVLTAKENTDSHRRQVKVTLTEGTTIREIEVVQEGIIKYVLPLLKVPASLGEVIRYERARGHELVKTPDGLINATSYRFTTQSKIMTFIQYEFKTDDAPGYTSAATICEDISLVKDNADFDAYLREQSFEKSEIAKDGSYVTYRSKTIPLEIKLDIKPGGVIIRTTYVPIQPKDYPTFKTFPLTDQIPYLGDRDLKIMGKKRADVHEAEKAWGGVLDTSIEQEDYERYKVSDSEYRGYFFVVATAKNKIPKDDPYIDVCHGLNGYYGEVTLGLWIDALGRATPTREVTKFLEDNGFIFYATLRSGAQAFRNKAKEQALVLNTTTIGGKTFLSVQMFLYRDKSSSSENSLTTLANYRSYLKAQQAKNEAVRRLEAYIANLSARH